MIYHLEQRIHTLAENGGEYQANRPPSFDVENVTFSQWQENREDWWKHHYWLAETEIEANDYIAAWTACRNKLIRIVPRMALVSQCYMEFLGQPILIKRRDSEVAFIHWIMERGPVTLMFMEEERKALGILLDNELILKQLGMPEEFFYYWNDAVNSSGYASKILLMLSAVETLVNIPKSKGKPSKNYPKLELILGPELKQALWGEEGNSSHALRHRLVHGLYFQPQDGQIDYLVKLHQQVIQYFNREVFKAELLHEGVVEPQRHPNGSREQARSFLRGQGEAKLCLIDVLADAKKNDIENLEHYETLRFDEFNEHY